MFRIWLVSSFILLGVVIGFSQSKKDSLPPVNSITSELLHQLVKKHLGKVILVNAWATWCKPCKEEIPDLLRLKNKYSGKGFDLIFVSADEIEELEQSVRPTLQELGVDFLTYINRDSSQEAFINGMSPKWNGALPASFIFDRKGNLQEVIVGGKKFEQFEQAVVRVLTVRK